MKFKFIASEATFLRYFIPIIIEGNKRGIPSSLYVIPSSKYNAFSKHEVEINKLAKEHNFEITHIGSLGDNDGITFIVENSGLDRIPSGSCIVSIAVMLDFARDYDNYIGKVNHVIFPGEFIPKHYGKVSEKNIYIGSPKYDLNMNNDEILQKYNLDQGSHALIIFPRLRDLSKIDLERIYGYLRDMGIKVIVKTRGKDIVPEHLRGDYYYEDFSWFPHTTMELIKVSDIVVNTDSGAIKECVMMDTPLVNFHIKPETEGTKRIKAKRAGFEFLYDRPYCHELSTKVKYNEFSTIVNDLLSKDLTVEFEKARNQYLFENKDVSKRILDYLLGEE